MNALLTTLFINNWERKCISLLLSIILWLVIHHSLTSTKILDNVAVRVMNIPSGMTIQGMQNGILLNKVSLAVQGAKAELDEITSHDIEVVLDAKDQTGEWLATISRKNLVSLNPDIDLSKLIQKVHIQRLPISFTPLVLDKIPIIVCRPNGHLPSGYEFIDIWPRQFTLTVSGPKPTVQQLKLNGIHLTFNFEDLFSSPLDKLSEIGNEISYLIPQKYKMVHIPLLSNEPFSIDDPQAAKLRIEILKTDFFPIENEIPILLHTDYLNSPLLFKEQPALKDEIIQQVENYYSFQRPLYVKGVSKLFLDLVKDKLQISIFMSSNQPHKFLDWSLQFLNSRHLEEKYISLFKNCETLNDMETPRDKEDYLRNKFHLYMSQIELYTANKKKFDLYIEVKDKKVVILEKNPFTKG